MVVPFTRQQGEPRAADRADVGFQKPPDRIEPLAEDANAAGAKPGPFVERFQIILQTGAGQSAAEDKLGVLDVKAFVEVPVEGRRAELDVSGECVLPVVK